MSMKYKDVTTSHYFQWFGVQQMGRIPVPGGSVVNCKPGGHQEYIDLRFWLDGEETVTRAELTIDRAWLEGARTAPFAADIAKSFVLTFAGEDRATQALGRQLELMMGNVPGVLSAAHPTDPVPADLRDVVSPALDVYAGRAARATVEAPQHRLVFANDDAPQRPRLSITWIAAPDAGRKGPPNGLLARVKHLLHT